MLLKRLFIAASFFLLLSEKPFAQVSLQTGSAVFSLSMFDWQDNQSRLASTVALSYSSGSGLKVNDMASNVGQGWSLIAGGVITRMQVGEPDDQPAYAGTPQYGNGSDQDITKYPAGYLYHTINPNTGCPTNLERYPTYGGKNVLYAPHNLINEDKQQDYFAFTFNGKSGMFILDATGGDHGVLLADSKMKIAFQRDPTLINSGIRTTITSFTITDVDGLIYKFANHGLTRILKAVFSSSDGTKQAGQPSIGNGGTYYQNGFDVGPTSAPWVNQYMANPYIINNWYLTEIDDPFTGRKISFSYNTLNLNITAGQDITYNSGSDNYVVVSYKKSMTTTQELASITYPDGHYVVFNYAGAQRADYPGEYALSSVDVHYMSRYISTYLLNTTYFILNRYGTPTTAYQKSVCRLCLRSVQKIGVDQKEDSPPYIFDYYLGSSNADDFVPPPFFYVKDIWGFYNGNNSILSNSPTSGSTNPVSLTATPATLSFNALKGLCFLNDNVSGTYYNAKSGFAQNGCLKQVIYPTGGSINYQYAQNTGSFMGSSTVLNVGGVHVAKVTTSDGGNPNGCFNPPMVTSYNYVVNGPGSASSLWGLETPVNSMYNTSYWQEEHQTIHFSWSNPFGTCLWHYIYPGILSQYESVSVENWQKIMAVLSPILGVLSVISTIDDIINVIASTGVGTIIAVVLDIATAVLGYILSCPQKTKLTTGTVYYDFDLNQISPLPAQFKRVEITQSPGGTGKTVIQYTNGDPTDPSMDYALWSNPGVNVTFSAKQRFAPWAYGLPKLTTVYDANGNKIRESQKVYNFTYAQEGLYDPGTCCASSYTQNASCKCLVVNSYSQRSDDWSNINKYNAPSTYLTSTNNDMKVDIYYFYTGRIQMTTNYERTYRTTDATQYVQTETDYTYNNGGGCVADNNCQMTYNNYEVQSVITHQSNGDVNYEYITYPGDYNTGILATLVSNNILSAPVSTRSYVLKADSSGRPFYLNEQVTEFGQVANGDIRPSRKLEQRFSSPTPNFTQYSGPTTTNYANYKITKTYTYDNNSNMVGVQDEGLRQVTNIYDYADKFITAVVVNANPLTDHPAYTSFENTDLSRSGWTITGISSFNPNVPAPTGVNTFALLSNNGNGLTTTNVLDSLKSYILSFWSSNGNVTVSSGATLVKSAPTYNGFTYYEYNIELGTKSVTLSNSTSTNANIDEVRLYPSNARMHTMTYDPIIGKTSDCDENNRITYYAYDKLGRLQFEKDESGNVVKMYEYNNVSAAAQTSCPVIYTNKLISEVFTMDNCAAGYQGGQVTYTVAAGTYSSSISQQDADAQAETYLLTNGQTYADANGTCLLLYYNVAESQTDTTQNCGQGFAGGTVTYTVPANTYSSVISQADANQQALNDLAANAQIFANSMPNMSCTSDTAADWEYFVGDADSAAGPSYCQTPGGQLPAIQYTMAKDVNPNSPTYNQTKYFNNTAQNSCPANTYYSAQQSQTFTRNNCGTGGVASSVTYTVPPGEYSSTVSQAAADAQATNDMSTNGQNYANTNGTCTYYNAAASQTFARNNCSSGQTGTSVTYTVPANEYSSTVSLAAANQLATNDINANGQNYANANGSCCNETLTYSSSITSSVVNTVNLVSGGIVDFTWVFTWPSGSTGFTVGTLNGSCLWPTSTRTIPFTQGSTAYNLSISSTGSVTISIASGPTPTGTVGFNGSYSLTQNAFYSVQESGSYTRNNCAAGQTGSTVTYTVAADAYSSYTSQAAANQLAINQVTANGQNYANSNGTCSVVCSFTFQSPISGYEGNISESGSTGSFTIVFPAPNSNYTGGTLGTIVGNCKPSGTRTVTVTDGITSTRSWSVTITSAGVISINLVGGTAASNSGPPVEVSGTYAL